ncbi:hypothetical protein, partial [Plasmodium yoelii yoelii]
MNIKNNFNYINDMFNVWDYEYKNFIFLQLIKLNLKFIKQFIT